MRFIATAAAVLGATLTTPAWLAAASADAPAPRPFTAKYEVTYRGMGAGALNFSFKKADTAGGYVFETTADPSVLARLVVSSAANERSVMEITPDGVRPLEWRLDDGRSSDKRDGALTFDWSQGLVTGTVEREQIELKAEPGTQDRLSIQIAASTALMRGEAPGTIPLIDDNRIKHYTYAKKEAASLATPLGELDTVIYESTRTGSSRVSRLWLAPELDYAPVRAEQIRDGKVETVMVLTEWEGGNDQGVGDSQRLAAP